jgi:hypothetical protein
LLEHKLGVELEVGVSGGWLDVNGVSKLEVALVLCIHHSLLDVNCAEPMFLSNKTSEGFSSIPSSLILVYNIRNERTS